MPKTNLEIVRDGYARFSEMGDFDPDIYADDFVWDMSGFTGWPERQQYEGIEGAREFMADWRETWKDWSIEVRAIHEAGDKVVVVLHQSGTSAVSGIEADMDLAQVWTMRDGLQVRMVMFDDPAAALESVGLPGSLADHPE
jgi:ketosteroid isomerase-like protein